MYDPQNIYFICENVKSNLFLKIKYMHMVYVKYKSNCNKSLLGIISGNIRVCIPAFKLDYFIHWFGISINKSRSQVKQYQMRWIFKKFGNMRILNESAQDIFTNPRRYVQLYGIGMHLYKGYDNKVKKYTAVLYILCIANSSCSSLKETNTLLLQKQLIFLVKTAGIWDLHCFFSLKINLFTPLFLFEIYHLFKTIKHDRG